MTTPFDIRLYPMVLVGCMLVTGILLGDILYSDALLSLLPWLMTLLLVCFFIALRLGRHSNILLLVALIVFGMLRISVSRHNLDVSLPSTECEYEAVIVSDPTVHGKVVWMDMLIVSPDAHPLAVKASLLRDTITHRYRQLHVGSGIRAHSLLEKENRSVRTFIYYKSWQAATVSLQSLSYFQRTRLRLLVLRQRLADVFGSQSVVRAMVLGDKSLLTRELRSDYSVSGVSHLLALSGLHLSIIYGFLSLLAFRLRRRALVQIAILVIVWGYVLLVGMMPSIVRAASMLSIYSVTVILSRDRLPVNTWASAGVLMLIANPQCLWDIGFLMSFLAVLSIILLFPLITRLPLLSRLCEWRIGRWGVYMLGVTLAAQIGTMPIIAHVFGRVSVYGLFVNFAAVPLATLLVGLAVAGLCLAWSDLLFPFLHSALSFVSHLLNSLVALSASLPGASLQIHFSLAQTICLYILLGVVVFFFSRFLPQES